MNSNILSLTDATDKIVFIFDSERSDNVILVLQR